MRGVLFDHNAGTPRPHLFTERAPITLIPHPMLHHFYLAQASSNALYHRIPLLWQIISALFLILTQLRQRESPTGRFVIASSIWRNPGLLIPLALVLGLLPDETRTPLALAFSTAFTWPGAVNIIRSLVVIFKPPLFSIAAIVFFIIIIVFIINSATTDPSMAYPSTNPSATEMNEKFLDGLTCPYDLYVAESQICEAGFGLFAREEIPAGKEVFRVAAPTVSVV